jgi:hypothetical protein
MRLQAAQIPINRVGGDQWQFPRSGLSERVQIESKSKWPLSGKLRFLLKVRDAAITI